MAQLLIISKWHVELPVVNRPRSHLLHYTGLVDEGDDDAMEDELNNPLARGGITHSGGGGGGATAADGDGDGDGEFEMVDVGGGDNSAAEYDATVDSAEDVAAHEQLELAREDRLFPDEVDTPMDMPASVRFQKHVKSKAYLGPLQLPCSRCLFWHLRQADRMQRSTCGAKRCLQRHTANRCLCGLFDFLIFV
jgi:hypothetical protein